MAGSRRIRSKMDMWSLLTTIGFVDGIWWLVEIPHRTKWGMTIAWVKKRGTTIPQLRHVFVGFFL